MSNFRGPPHYRTGGNPDLLPETTRSDNIGVIISPPWLGGVRLSIDYLRSERNDAITTTSVQQIADLDSNGSVSGRITRAIPEAGAPNGVGVITFVDARSINFRKISSQSADITLDAAFEHVLGGRLFIAIGVTRNYSFKIQTSNVTAATEQVRNSAASLAQQIKWNGNSQIRWERRNWLLGWNVRYFDKLVVRPAELVRQGSDHAPEALEHDLLVSYTNRKRFGRWINWAFADTKVVFGVKNITNREPRYWSLDLNRGTVPFDSLAGRSFWLQLVKDF